MNAIDWTIVGLAALAALYGFRRGFALTAGQYAGMAAGLVGAALLAPPVLERASVTDPLARTSLALGMVIAGMLLGVQLGAIAAIPARRLVSADPAVGVIDSTAGAMLSVLIALSGAWFFARSLDEGPNEHAARMIQQSLIVQKLDAVAPDAPRVLADFEAFLSHEINPLPFIRLEPPLPARRPIDPAAAATPEVARMAANVLRVQGTGCGGVLVGSGFTVGNGLVVTNAHVVAGTHSSTVQAPGGRQFSGQVVLFDAHKDLAVLRVPNLRLPAAGFGTSEPGLQGAVVGYPGGGPEQVVPAVVDGQMRAQGRDIWGESAVTRDILVLNADVRPGNSGGPVLAPDGRVIGMVFAQSVSRDNTGFALATSEIQADLATLAAGSPVMDAGRNRCADG